jgi:hypothetical protein
MTSFCESGDGIQIKTFLVQFNKQYSFAEDLLRQQAKWKWRKLHDRKLHDLQAYCSSNIRGGSDGISAGNWWKSTNTVMFTFFSWQQIKHTAKLFAFRFSGLRFINYISYNEDVWVRGGRAPPSLTWTLGGNKLLSTWCPNRFIPPPQYRWCPDLVWTLWRREKSLTLVGNQTPIPRPPVVVIPTQLSHCWKCEIIEFTVLVSLNCNPGVSGLMTAIPHVCIILR